MSATSDEQKKIPVQDQVNWWFCGSGYYSADDIRLLRASFAGMKDHLSSVGIAAFTRLFDEHPQAFRVFVGKSVLPDTPSDVKYSWETKQHSLRVFHAMEKCLNRVNQPEPFKTFIKELATRHVLYGAHPTHIVALMGCLREAYLDELKKQWPHLRIRENVGDSVLQAEDSSLEAGDHHVAPSRPQLDSNEVERCASAWNKFFAGLALGIVTSMAHFAHMNTAADASAAATSASPTPRNSSSPDQQHHQAAGSNRHKSIATIPHADSDQARKVTQHYI